jgi:hypothetical protein
MQMPRNKLNPAVLDPGIRDSVLLLRKAGFKTFTSCEGGKGHAFQRGTIGLELEGTFPSFQKKLLAFLRSHGMECFQISLHTSYHPNFPKGRICVYVEGSDLLPPEKKRTVMATMKRRERRLRQLMRELGIELPES